MTVLQPAIQPYVVHLSEERSTFILGVQRYYSGSTFHDSARETKLCMKYLLDI